MDLGGFGVELKGFGRIWVDLGGCGKISEDLGGVGMDLGGFGWIWVGFGMDFKSSFDQFQYGFDFSFFQFFNAGLISVFFSFPSSPKFSSVR